MGEHAAVPLAQLPPNGAGTPDSRSPYPAGQCRSGASRHDTRLWRYLTSGGPAPPRSPKALSGPFCGNTAVLTVKSTTKTRPRPSHIPFRIRKWLHPSVPPRSIVKETQFLLFHQTTHVVQAGLLDGGHKTWRPSRAPWGEDLPGEGGVLDFHDLVVAGEDDLVLPPRWCPPRTAEMPISFLSRGWRTEWRSKTYSVSWPQLWAAASAIIRAVPLGGVPPSLRWWRSTISMS